MSDVPSPFGEEEQSQDRAVEEPSDARGQDRGEGHKSDVPWIGGAVLLLMGIVFLLQNLGVSSIVLENWWAVFILIPAVTTLARAWDAYRRSGRLDRSAVGSLVGGSALTLLAFSFLLDLQWEMIWPVFLILAGLGLLLTAIP